MTLISVLASQIVTPIRAVIAALTAAAAILLLRRRGGGNRALPRHRRRASYGTTRLMAHGSMPAPLTLDKYDSTITIAMRLNGAAPSLTVIAALFLEHAWPHVQFHGVPTLDTDGSNGGHIRFVPCSGCKTPPGVDKAADLEAVMSRLRLVCTAGKDETDQVLERLMNATAELRSPDHPWWDATLIDEAGTESTLAVRVQHCIGDGVSLTRVLGRMLSADAAGAPLAPEVLAGSFRPKRDADGDAVPGSPARSRPLGETPAPAAATPSKPAATATAPASMKKPGIAASISYAGSFVYRFMKWAVFSKLPADTPNAFRGGASGPWPYQTDVPQVAVQLRPHSLQMVKDIKNNLAAWGPVTVNDVEFAAFAGAMRKYLVQYGGMSDAEVSAGRFRALTPFAVPPKPEVEDTPEYYTNTLVNTWTFVENRLPVQLDTPAKRLVASCASWGKVKSTAAVAAGLTLLRVGAGLLPVAMQRETARDVLCKPTVVFSNVPGPQVPVFIAGREVCGVRVLYPNLVSQLVIFSLNGTVFGDVVMRQCGAVGTEADVKVAFPRLFEEELAALVSASKAPM
jgi:hypothetical protein